jgi:hypothetical protein
VFDIGGISRALLIYEIDEEAEEDTSTLNLIPSSKFKKKFAEEEIVKHLLHRMGHWHNRGMATRCCPLRMFRREIQRGWLSENSFVREQECLLSV